MIRIRAYNFRQAFEKLFSVLMFFVICILIFFFSLMIAYFMKKEFENGIIINGHIEEEVVFSKSMFVNNILNSELSFLVNKKMVQEEDLNKDELEHQENLSKHDTISIEVQEIPKLNYEIPQKYETNIFENGKIEVGNTRISNYSNLEIDLEELSKPMTLKLDSQIDFLIYHTHATESYTIENQAIENYRTTKPEYNMISIGNTLKKELEKREFSTLHDTILHDYPNYNGSYAHSLETITKYMKTKNFDFVLDIHRDAISSDLSYGPVCEIQGERAAQLMFVVGTNASGLKHDEWMKNLKLALLIQNRANEMYPGLFRDINLSKSRYNQHVSSGAFIIEVGTTGNTLEEAKVSMKYLANVIESFK